MDRPAARTEVAGLGHRRAAGGEQQRHAVAREIDQIVDRVGGADVDVHHHGLRAAGHQIGAVRHGDGEVLVRHQYRARDFGVAGAGAAERLDDRREVGPRIGEEEIDAVLGERAQEHVAGDRRAGFFLRHGSLPSTIEHDAEKWVPVFGKHHAQTIALHAGSFLRLFGAAAGAQFSGAHSATPWQQFSLR
jgi:hypothetical protein